MTTYAITIRGRSRAWGFRAEGSASDAEDWRADGLEVCELVNVIPAWLPRWVWAQDWRLVP